MVQGEPPAKLNEGTDALLLELLDAPPGKLDGWAMGSAAGTLVLEEAVLDAGKLDGRAAGWASGTLVFD